MVINCEFCNSEKDILKGFIEKFNNIYLFGMKKDDVISYDAIRKAFEEEEIRVFYDRGYLRLTKGEDINCIDHSIDYVKINYCPKCGREL